MISVISLMLIVVIFASQTFTFFPVLTENVLVQKVKNLDAISMANYDDSYLGAIFYQSIDESKIEYVNSKSLLSEINEYKEDYVEGKLLGKYFYEVEEGIVGEGYLIGTDFTTNEYLDKMVDTAKEEIKSGKIQRDYQNANARSIVSMAIGQSWSLVTSKKITWSLDYEDIHYGDFAEWYSSFKILTDNYAYYLIAHETYIAPNNDGTDDFRTSRLTYNFISHSQVELRDYQPKSKNPNMTISYGVDLSAEISSDSSSTVSAGVSSTYSTILESPKVYDKGNMANDEVNIEFEYHNAWSTDEPWLSYNTNQSMQTAIYIIRENINTGYVVNYDFRTIQMVRDDLWFWNDKTVNFKMDMLKNGASIKP